MPGAFLSLNGARVTSGHVSIPYYGTWNADFMMPKGTTGLTVGSAVKVTLGNLNLVGTVYRSAAFAGQLKVRCMGGAGGWQKTVTKQQYALDSGVQLSTVLKDLAMLVGETVNIANDSSLGSSFVREAASAGRILRQIAGPLWWVDITGVTQIAPARPTSTISTAFQVVNYDGDRGLFEIATEDFLAWQPGAMFSNEVVTTPQTISLSTIDTDNNGVLRFTVLNVGPPTDRLIDDFRALIREEVEELTFLGVYEYSVQSSDGSTVDASPTADIPLPSLRKVPLRTGIPGSMVTPAVGSLLAVSFLNGDPTKAVVLGGYDSTAATTVTLSSAQDYTISSQQDVDLTAQQNVKATAQSSVTLSALGGVILQGGAGGSEKPVVCYGDLVMIPGLVAPPSGGPVTGAGPVTASGSAAARIVKVKDAFT